MVLYGFKKEFAPLVENGFKPHTIRDLRKDDRHAKPGDMLQLYTGLRTKSARKLIPDPPCWAVFDIVICSGDREVYIGDQKMTEAELRFLINRDGFLDPDKFWEFFPAPYLRKLICWQEVHYLNRFIKQTGEQP